MDNLVDTDDEDFAVEDELVDTDQDPDDLVDSDEDEGDDEPEKDQDDLVDAEDEEQEAPRSGRFRLDEAIDQIIAREANRSRESVIRDTKRARL